MKGSHLAQAWEEPGGPARRQSKSVDRQRAVNAPNITDLMSDPEKIARGDHKGKIERRQYMFKKGSGDWVQYRKLPKSTEVDFHHSDYGPRNIPYGEAMNNVWEQAFEALTRAYQQGLRYVIFTHGASTSRPGKTTARSQIRNLMRSRAATPYIRRSECIQHKIVFVAAIRPKSECTVYRNDPIG